VNRLELQQLADLRIAEAQALLALAVPLPDGAYYLAGYAVECALKACIAKGYAVEAWPEKEFVARCHTHNLLELARLAGLEPVRALQASTNSTFADNWLIVSAWSERARYERHSQFETQELYDAISDAFNGVLPWIKVHW
jgi:hypothetical protein